MAGRTTNVDLRLIMIPAPFFEKCKDGTKSCDRFQFYVVARGLG